MQKWLLVAVLWAFCLPAMAQFNETDIVITEISYNPPESGVDSLEYIELYNAGSSAVNLNGYTFTQGVDYTFSNYTLNAGEYVVVAVNPGAILRNFGTTALAWTSGGLSNSGEIIELRTAASGGTLVDIVEYDDAGAWPADADQGGSSLVLCDPTANNNLGTSWIAATTSTGIILNGLDLKGNPGAADSGCPQPCPDLSPDLVLAVTNISCNGGTNGAINLTVNAGTPPYTFHWAPGNGATEDTTNLAVGTYYVTVTDANGCTGNAFATVSEPTAISFLSSVGNVSCNGGNDGSIDIAVSGGNGPYAYLWSNGEVTVDVSNLEADTYTVTVTDDNGCTATDSYTVTEPAAITVTETIQNVACNGDASGAINLNVSGGSGYTYLWSNTETTEDISGLAAGVYTVTITYGSGCTYTDSYTVSEPTALTVSASATNVSCNAGADGSIDITVSGGAAGYTYSWSDGPATEDRISLSAGSYIVTVTDANACSISQSYTITEPSALSLSATQTDVTCNGGNTGAIDLTVTGAVTPYTYVWSNSATTEDLSALPAGSYTVTVTDDNNCTASATYTITEPTAIGLSATTTDPGCGASNGTVDLTVTGGLAPYTYNWSNSTTMEDLANVAAGSYSVTVTDDNGCTATASITLSNPAAPTVTGSVTDATCFGGNNGAIDITVSGGATPYTYNWNNSETTEDLSGITAGGYTVTVTDNNGCDAVGSYTVDEATAIAVAGAITDPSCGGTDGAIDLTVSGGAAPYSFIWSNAATTEDISNLAAGAYEVTVTDDNGCTETESFSVLSAGTIVIAGSVTDASCLDSLDGAIDVTVSGGVTPYTYSWNNTATTEDLTGLAAGSYVVSVTDNDGCLAADTFSVSFLDSCITGIGGPEIIAGSVELYPNPASGLVVVELTGAETATAIEVFAISGQVVAFEQLTANQRTISMDVNNLAEGLYMVVVRFENGQVGRSKLMISRR